MKRVKETEFLRLEKMTNICDDCRRWNGDFTENNLYVCKYNTNNKGKINIDISTNSNMKASIASISKDDESISKILNDTEGFDKCKYKHICNYL